jgi:hypothetical protein
MLPLTLLAAPQAPSNLNLTPHTHSVDISWSDNSLNESGFKIFRDDRLVGIVGPNITNYTDLGLESSTTYRYTIKATDDELVEFRMKNLQFDKDKTPHYGIFIDSDNNPNSGYIKDKIKGADLFLEDSKIYLRTETSSKWSKWRELGKFYSLKIDGSDTIAIVPKNLLNGITIKSNAPLLAYHYDENWVKKHAGNGGLTSSDIGSLIDSSFKFALKHNPHGVELVSVSSYGRELLVSEQKSVLFSAKIRNISTKDDISITAKSGWQNVSVDEVRNGSLITLSNPLDTNLPSTLKAIVSIQKRAKGLDFDMKIEGVGEHHSLMELNFPNISFKASSNSHLFISYHFGMVIDDPAKNAKEIKSWSYPLGMGSVAAGMQYMAYYDDEGKGLYFGFADPDAGVKNLLAEGKDGSITIGSNIPVENMTLPNNDYSYPGAFQLRAFEGDWFDAAMIYKEWVQSKANYRVVDNLHREERLLALAKNDLQGTQAIWNQSENKNYKVTTITDMFTDLKNELDSGGEDIVLGAYWYAPYGRINESQFPSFIPHEDISKINRILKDRFADKINLMIYTNAYLYDKHISDPQSLDIPSFEDMKDSVAVDINGQVYEQTWEGGVFARMDPSQTKWQDLLAKIHHKYLNPLQDDGVLLDQVTAGSNMLCFNKNHHHPLGGGHYWREGYVQLLKKLHKSYSDNRYFISEAFNDSLVNEIVGYETIYYINKNMVPAVQAVYGDKVEFIGARSGGNTYDDNVSKADSPNLYATQMVSFIYGNIPGYFYPDIADINNHNANTQRVRAMKFVRRLATMRHKLKEFLSNAVMLRPLKVEGDIPTIVIPAVEGDHPIDEGSIPAILNSVWKSKSGKIALIFANAQNSDSNQNINFSFNFDASKYGIDGEFGVVEVKESSSQDLGSFSGSFSKNITLTASDIIAYIIEPK